MMDEAVDSYYLAMLVETSMLLELGWRLLAEYQTVVS